MSSHFADLFSVRRSVARIGQADWMAWWDCHALSPTGDYVVGRLFPRTPELSAAHIALIAARAEHQRRVPQESLIHLFDLGEAFEGAFERWLIARKADGWVPEVALPDPPESSQTDEGVDSAFAAVGLDALDVKAVDTDTVLVDTVDADVLANTEALTALAHRLASAYGASGKKKLVAPYVRLRS